MRILLVHNHYQISGGESVVFEAEKHLLQDFGEDVFTYERHNDEIKTLRAAQSFKIPGEPSVDPSSIIMNSKSLNVWFSMLSMASRR